MYRQYTPRLQYQPCNFPFQGNQQPPGGETPQVNSFVPPNPKKPYPRSVNPTWGQHFQSNALLQGSIPNHPTHVGYLTQNPSQKNLTGPSNYLQTAYGPIGGIPIGLPPQNYQFSQVNRQLSFLATLDLPNLSRVLNDHVLHSPYWSVIHAKLPSDIPNIDGLPREDPNNHVM
jgi:hypothetical protein